MFAYCQNNPVNMSDDHGNIPSFITFIISVASAAVDIGNTFYSVNSNSRIEPHKKEFVKETYGIARMMEIVTGIPASVVTAQACIESAYGTITPKDKTSGEESYNLFGVKAYGNVPYVICSTREVINGQDIYIDAKFRKYGSYADSLDDHSRILLSNYKKYVTTNTPIAWADVLQKYGYATAPNYSKTILDVIDYWGLR